MLIIDFIQMIFLVFVNLRLEYLTVTLLEHLWRRGVPVQNSNSFDRFC